METSIREKRHPLISTRMRAFGRLIVRHSRDRYPHICSYYIRKHGFSDLSRLPQDSSDKSKLAHLKDLMIDLIYLVRNLGYIRKAREIIAFGPMAKNIALLLKLGLLPLCRRVYWFGLFIHSPQWIRIFRFAFRILDSRRIQYVLFSHFEKSLYAKSLLLSENRMLYVPYGDLSEEKDTEAIDRDVAKDMDFGKAYFSGGDSNRDYLSLIEEFRTLPYRLVIICSSRDPYIDESSVPPNVKVMRDVPSELFDAYLRAAKACIIPIAHDTGAAGQSCLLRYMKNRKIIIATDTGIIREYITNGISGILVKNNHMAMREAILSVDENSELMMKYADAAWKRFEESFSGEAITRRLDQIIKQDETFAH